MAHSNVRSSEYRAAGGRKWFNVKSPSFVTHDGPVPLWLEQIRHDNAATNDAAVLTKAEVKRSLAEGYDESLITVIKDGKRTEAKTSKKVLTQRRKRETVAPSKRLNRKEKRALKFNK